jgi:hypothetical protein
MGRIRQRLQVLLAERGGQALVCFLTLVPLPGAASAVQVPAEARYVDLALKGDLTGDGRVYRVEWYHRGPIDSANPPSYVLGVSVRAPSENSPVLAQWEAAQPTSVLAADPNLHQLWPIPDWGGRLITTNVSRGSNTTELTALRFDGRRLRMVGHWENAAFSLTRLGLDKRLVVIQTGSGSDNLPSIYAWNGNEFKEMSRDFPEYYANWGAPFVKEIRNSEPTLADVIAVDCQSATKAFAYADEPQVGRQACLEARKRLSAGWAIIPARAGESAQDFDREKNAAIQTVDQTLTERKNPRPESARVSRFPR